MAGNMVIDRLGGYLIKLAELLRLERIDIVRSLWNEEPGEQCKCGCGSTRIFPFDLPNARHLAFERVCDHCQQKRIYKIKKNHHRNCQICARIKTRVVLTCVGFRDPLWKKDGAIRRNRIRRLEMLETALRAYNKRAQQAEINPSHWGNQPWRPGRYGQIKWARAFRDEKTRKFRCEPCARSSFATAMNEQKLKTFLQEHKIRYGRIESRDERRELISTFLPRLNPNFVAKKTRWPGGRRAGQKNRRPAFWKNVFFRLGRCVFCKKLTFSRAKDGPTRSHRTCYLIQGGRKKIPKSLGAGQPVTEEKLQKYLKWTEDHYFRNKSYREIAQGVHFTLVRQKIDFIIAKLPDPAILEKRFARRVSALIAASQIPSVHAS
jgi:hypothetical protein